MAITLADFTKIWASTSPLTPYSFSDSNYQEGWNFVGSTPPARQMWDSIQKQNDEKLKYIVDNYLSTAGGTMTGAIVLADGGNPLSTAGGTMTGAIVGNPLTLTADDENDSADLVLDPSGSATWNGKQVERVIASGTDYIRYESGLQICWGLNNVSSSGTVINFPVPFVSIPRFGAGTSAQTNFGILQSDVTTTSFKGSANVGNVTALWWIAIGFWK